MSNRKKLSPTLLAVAAAAGCATAAEDDAPQEALHSLTAVCVDTASSAPPGAWICGDPLAVECTGPQGADPGIVHVVAGSGTTAAGLTCASETFTVNDPGPFAVGRHEVIVSRASGDEACRSSLTVADTSTPAVTVRDVLLWPPNHRMRRVTPADCLTIRDTCDSNVIVHFTYAASDEPQDDRGDGHHQPDIVNLDCESVEVRSERQGGGNGRVYTLGFYAVDDSGNSVEGTCRVIVPHDQSGRAAVDDGENHRVDLTAACF